MLAIIKKQVFRKKNRRRLELSGSEVGAILCCCLPPARFVGVVAGFVSLHLLDYARVRKWHPAVFHKDLIPVGMVTVVMRIKSKSYRLGRQGANFVNDQLC